MTQITPTHPTITGSGEGVYWLAVGFVTELDARLVGNSIHLYDCDGRLLTTLDQWLLAVEEKRWPVLDERIMQDENYGTNGIFDRVETRAFPEPTVF